MAQRILGIDLGTYSLKLVLVERSLNEFRIVKLAEHLLSSQTRLPHEELVRLGLEQVLQANAFPADTVSTSYPGHLYSTRIVDIPLVKNKEIARSIDFELEGHLPFDLEDVFYDYHVLEKTDKSYRVLCSYMMAERFGRYMENLKNAGIDPKFFGTDAVDLSALAHVAMVPEQEYYAFCDIGHSKTNICLMKGRELKYVRTIGIGGLHFTRAIQRTFNVNYEKAESLKLSRGKLHIRDEDADQISRILEHVAAELVSGIKQGFLAFENMAGRQPIAAIYVTGGGSRMKGILDFLSFHLRTNVLELDGLSILPNPLDDPSEIAPIMGQAVAAAMKPSLTSKMPRINFRKGPFVFKQEMNLVTSEFKSAAVFASVILLLAGIYYAATGYYFDGRKESVDRYVLAQLKSQYRPFYSLITSKKADDEPAPRGRIGVMPVSEAEIRSFNPITLKATAESKLRQLKQQSEAISMASSADILAIMQEISQKLPQKKDVQLEITEFDFTEDQVRMNARTNDPLNVDKVVFGLKQSEAFSDVRNTDARQQPGAVWDFILTLKIKKADEESAADEDA